MAIDTDDAGSARATVSPLRSLVGLALGPVLFAVVLALPLDLNPRAHRLAAVFAWATAWWATEAVPVPVTAILAPVLCVILGISSAQAAFSAFGDPIIFLFIGSFIMAQAFQVSGLDTRVAFGILRLRWATRTPGRLLATLGFITWLISLWVSNTATTAIMLPIGLGILRNLRTISDSSPSRLPTGLLLMLTWASSVAVGLPIGSPPNLIAMSMIRELAGRRMTLFEWAAIAMPLAAIMLGLSWLILWSRYGARDGRWADARNGVQSYIEAQHKHQGPLSRAEINIFVVFVAVVILWLLPGAIATLTSPEAPVSRWFETRLPESVVALAAAVCLFVLPVDLRRKRFTINWRQAVSIDWGTILLFGGGLSLGKLMFETKLAEALGRAAVGVSGVNTVWALTAVAIGLGIVISEMSSNTASASMIIPAMIAVAQGAGFSPVPPALGAALGASFGFMLPVSTPSNAIVYGSGLVPLREMIAAGIWLDVAGGVLIWIGIRVLCPLFGLL